MSVARNAIGKVAWRKGDKRAKEWVSQQRAEEASFYGAVYGQQNTAHGVATSMATDVNYDIGSNTLGLTESEDGAAKAAKALKDTRDQYGPIYLPMTRGGTEDATTWTLDESAMDAWVSANSSPGGSYNWWEKARVVSAAVDEWHTLWGTTGADFNAAS